jgi:esterase/lipase superfamily enzyme
MHHEHKSWRSPSLDGKEMSLHVWGHSGAKMLVFPTSLGSHREWTDRRMQNVLRDQIDNGWLQIVSVDHVHHESWYDKDRHPGARAWRHLQYHQYIRDEVMPYMHHINRNPYMIVAGASFGAYHAMSFGLRFPHLVDRIIGLSGLYDISRQASGYSDGNVYASNPMAFMAREHDHNRLEAMRRIDIIMAIGRDDPSCQNNEEFSSILWSKGVGNALRVWDGWSHDWPYWEKMIRMYVSGHD